MGLLLLILGSVFVAGAITLDVSPGPDDTDSQSDTHDQNTSEEETEPAQDSSSSSILDFAVEPEQYDSATDATVGEDLSDSTEEGAAVYAGVSDELMGYSDKSFGIAHRFNDGDGQSDVLSGTQGDDTLYGMLGDTLSGGSGADDFVIFAPDALVETLEPDLTDFDPESDTVTIILEQSKYLDEDGVLVPPDVSLEADSTLDNTSRVVVNGENILELAARPDELSVAYSTDGYGEEYFDESDLEIDDSQLETTTIKIVFLNNLSLYGE